MHRRLLRGRDVGGRRVEWCGDDAAAERSPLEHSRALALVGRSAVQPTARAAHGLYQVSVELAGRVEGLRRKHGRSARRRPLACVVVVFQIRDAPRNGAALVGLRREHWRSPTAGRRRRLDQVAVVGTRREDGGVKRGAADRALGVLNPPSIYSRRSDAGHPVYIMYA